MYLYLELDNKILSVNKLLCEKNEYLNSIKHIQSSRENPFFVDRNYELANEIISAYRYDDLNMLSEIALYELEIWNDTNIYDESNAEVINLEVGGQMFKTTKKTLNKCSYYFNLFNTQNYKHEPLDMNPEAFKQILNYMRNKKYKLDIGKYQHEIIFLGININDIDINQFKKNEEIKLQTNKYNTVVNTEFKNNNQDTHNLPQEIYLSGSPQITYAKQIYKRYTDFNMVNNCIDKQMITGNYYEKEFPNVNNIMSLFIGINGYNSSDDVYDLMENVNITISGVEFINLSGEAIKIFYNTLKPKMDKSNGLAILLNYGVPIPVFTLNDKNMKIKIKFREDINSEVTIGIRYMIMKSLDEINKFKSVGHEYLFRQSVEYTLTLTENQKKVFYFPHNYLAEHVYFSMPNQTCDITGKMTSGSDIYTIDKYHSKDCIKLLYEYCLPNNVYMCTSNIGEGATLQPNGQIVLKTSDKIEITPNYTGKLIIVMTYFNVLRLTQGVMLFAYNSTENIQTYNNLEYDIPIKVQKIVDHQANY